MQPSPSEAAAPVARSGKFPMKAAAAVARSGKSSTRRCAAGPCGRNVALFF